MALAGGLDRGETTLRDRAARLDLSLPLLVLVIACFGFAVLFSAADGRADLSARPQAIRFAVFAAFMLGIALVDLRFWLRWAYAFYGAALVLLAAVEAAGVVGGGAQRWIALGPVALQPSEVMKIALTLALARYFHRLGADDAGRLRALLPPLAMAAAPAALVLRQPDLGTAAMLVLGALAVMFAAGVRWWKFAAAFALAGAAAPLVWSQLHAYQRRRVLTFLDPETDPLGAGYHILQSKIALGSGGLFGKGFLEGTQTHLSFLPERHTDFVFAVLAEELGLAGAGTLLLLYALVFACGFAIALRANSQFGRLLAVGVVTTLFLYVFINVAMVTGLIPVVGVPLPLISYGGTAMLTAMSAVGFLLCVQVHRDLAIGRGDGWPD